MTTGLAVPVDSNSGTSTTTMVHIFEPGAAGTASLGATPQLFARAATRVRGSSSAGFPKKSYALEIRDELNGDLDQSLLGLSADSDWVMNGPWLYDDTFIHNAYINELQPAVRALGFPNEILRSLLQPKRR
jgi:hypothetical protein